MVTFPINFQNKISARKYFFALYNFLEQSNEEKVTEFNIVSYYS